ncbi:MAG: spore germination protein GerW family protein [Armatimonadota bacterium]
MAVQDMLQSVSDKIGAIANVNTVFGEPRVMNNRAIIPVALVAGGFGAGGGEGQGGAGPEGSGGGGGAGFMVRPLAVLEISDAETKLVPILDMTRVVLAGMGLLGGLMWMLARRKKR